jgi:predicted DNA-binding transcriptional regulator YafY
MPYNKSAVLRYQIIDDILSSKQLGPDAKTKEAIISTIESRLGITLSESMFHKDINSMRSIYSAPLEFDRYNKCYCYTQPDFSIKGLALTDEEKESLSLALAILEQLKGTQLFQHFGNAINKVIKGCRMSEFLGKSEKQILQVEEPSPGAGEKWVDAILKNIVEGKKGLCIHYEPYDRDPKIHEFSPYLVKEYRNRWYTIGYSERASSVIVLALDRIKKIEPGNNKFVFNSDFKPEEYFKYSMGITQIHEAKPEIVELSFSPDQLHYVLSQPWHASQQIIRKKGQETVIRLQVYLTHELTMAILSCGPHVKVLKPARLVKTIKNTIEKMKERYRSS